MPDAADDDLEARVRDLEHEVLRLKESVEIARADAAAARVLAGGADRDASDTRALLHAHTQTLTALREAQLEQQDEVKALRSDMQRGFGMLQTGIAQIVAALPGRKDEDDQPG